VVTLVVGIASAILGACSVGTVDFSNKACPCGTGYVCDTARDVCVLPSELHAPVVESGAPDAPVSTPPPSDAAIPIEAGPVDAGCVGDTCPCTGDGECKDHALPHCGPNHRCVACVAQTDCGSGTYCNASNQCVLGCKQESDCQISPTAPHCDLARHQCVECRSLSDCTGPADRCSPSGQCVLGCNLDAGLLCAPGKSCCGGLCIDTSADPMNCGGCGVTCSTENATPTCSASTCSWACADGYLHCGTTNSGCETNIRTDATHCGSCSTNCAGVALNATGILCNAGNCDYTACTANYMDCDGVHANGCECTCGTKRQERCCPGALCNAPLTCNTAPDQCK
jgi:hypothetical protein